MAVLEITDLHQQYGEQVVLSIDHFQIDHGIYWIQGVNGAGKSTLFRTMAGMLPHRGDIVLSGQYHLGKHPVDYRLRLNLGEAEPLYPSFLTPRDLLHFVGEAKRSPAGQSEMLITALGIDYLDTPFGSCSSGMVKKVSLALAFLGQPSLIILDEPLITIDRQAQTALFGLIRSHYDGGVTFLLSSHQLFEENGLPMTQSFALRNRTLVAAGL
jgi:ABC-2 type transport system ATP-binding protein